ncbi:MAG: efflux RND transporter periplasmic adaptor subunit [Oscillospiraceae bacterium]|nr:efflux RND transporter periplasmic adaptor subunit [Oscillospiraceae bacterium]
MREKRILKRVLFLLPVSLVVLALVALPFLLDKAMEGDGASLRSAAVQRADISRTVSGAGTLEAKEASDLSLPEGVVITGYLVADGDMVKKGDPVAEVDPVSVYKTASLLAEKLDAVTQELAALQNSTSSAGTIYSQVSGNVTAMFARPDDDIRQVMDEHGALCEITLDDGTVLKVTATSGTITWCYFREGNHVYDGAPLFLVKDIDAGNAYGALVLRRQKIEDQMGRLFRMLKDGYAAAPAAGMITGTDESLVKELAARSEGGLHVKLLADLEPAEPETEPISTTYLSGMLISALDDAFQGAVSGIPGTVDFSGFPDAKPGDTVFLQADTYVTGEGDEQTSLVVYTVLLVVPGAQTQPTIVFSLGGLGGGDFSFGGAAAPESAETAEALPETCIASVIPMDEVLVKIRVDELDILSLHPGDAARVTIDALPGRAFAGRVSAVNTGRSNSGGNSKYFAEISIPLEENMLIGMNASCLVTVETFRDVLSVPAEAICDEPGGSVIYTALSADGSALAAPVPVTLGLSDGQRVELLSGLSEGDTIWYSVFDTPEYSVPGPAA